ncbi:MAG TPA: hypothetical protein VMZ53_11425 [Kofleriaceae bacterium]|nr:hypothetical protein [Kofleriaceae bacterium]
MTDRVCAQGGLLVDGDTRLLTDPCEYYQTGLDLPVGCGRLRCSNCKEWVRAGPPKLGFKKDAPHDLRALHAAPDWSVLPFIESRYALSRQLRLYACTCTYWEAESVDPIDNDHELASDPNVPWRCAGHPAPDLPLTLNGLRIDAATNWAQLVDKVLKGSCPRELDRMLAIGPEPAIWLSWLYGYLQGLSVADALSAAIADRLQDSDPQVVGRVLFFFTRFPRAVGIVKLVEYAEANPLRVALGYPIPEYRSAPTLWGVLIAHAVTERAELAARVDTLIKRLMFIPRASLPHDDLGPAGTVDFERQRSAKLGYDAKTTDWLLKDFSAARTQERIDVVGNAIAHSPGLFDDEPTRTFLADKIVELDAACPGRWRQVMTLLTDWIGKPAQGHLVVIAGARIIQAGLTTPAEFRAWIESRRAYGWVDDAWVLPLETMLDEKN